MFIHIFVLQFPTFERKYKSTCVFYKNENVLLNPSHSTADSFKSHFWSPFVSIFQFNPSSVFPAYICPRTPDIVLRHFLTTRANPEDKACFCEKQTSKNIENILKKRICWFTKWNSSKKLFCPPPPSSLAP